MRWKCASCGPKSGEPGADGYRKCEGECYEIRTLSAHRKGNIVNSLLSIYLYSDAFSRGQQWLPPASGCAGMMMIGSEASKVVALLTIICNNIFAVSVWFPSWFNVFVSTTVCMCMCELVYIYVCGRDSAPVFQCLLGDNKFVGVCRVLFGFWVRWLCASPLSLRMAKLRVWSMYIFQRMSLLLENNTK